MAISTVIETILGPDLPVGFRAYDGSELGPPGAPATIVMRSVDAVRRIVTAPGELGLARAYVAGDLDLEGDVFALIDLRDRVQEVKLTPSQLVELVREVGPRALLPLPPPPEEARLRGRRHSKERDAAAIRHHYDVGNDFYRLVLGPAMTYSCAVFTDPRDTLEQAQANKHELVSQKLGLDDGVRLLDVGCGWGSMVLHAAQEHGARATGVTISPEQRDLALERIDAAGFSGKATVRLQDYRDIDDGPYDAISSIGMFEHVGAARLAEYFAKLHSLLRPGGRLLNHGISRPPGKRARLQRAGFIDRYVFPDGELHEVGTVVSAIQQAGFEVRHVETLREHYALTLRRWVANLERSWDEAVALVGPNRARIWRLYMAGCAANFEWGNTQVHQVLAVKPDRGRSGMGLRPHWHV